MLNEKELPFLAEKGHIVSLVGGGGKTTLLYAMADHCAHKGWRVVVMTTTTSGNRQPAMHRMTQRLQLCGKRVTTQ